MTSKANERAKLDLESFLSVRSVRENGGCEFAFGPLDDKLPFKLHSKCAGRKYFDDISVASCQMDKFADYVPTLWAQIAMLLRAGQIRRLTVFWNAVLT
jgi:hypothetical protein